jgi:hypothetical protein
MSQNTNNPIQKIPKIKSSKTDRIAESAGERVLIGIIENLLKETAGYWKRVKKAESGKEYAEINANLMHVITSCSIALDAYEEEIVKFAMYDVRSNAIHKMIVDSVNTIYPDREEIELPL